MAHAMAEISEDRGTVYVLSNESLKGMVKIGYTTRCCQSERTVS